MEKSLYRMINVALLVCIVMFGAGSYLGITSVGVVHVLVGVAAMSVFVCLKALSAKGRFLCLVGIFACLGAVGLVVGLENCILFWDSYVNWLLGRPVWQEKWVAGYAIIQVLWIVLFCYVWEMILEKEFRLKVAGASLILVILLICLFGQREIARVAVVSSICYLLMVFVEWTQERWSKEKSRSVEAYMLWLSPFLVVYFLLLSSMPVQQKPYDWEVFKVFFKQVSETVLVIAESVMSGGREDYDLSLSGFSASGDIGGGVLANDREILTMEGSRGLVTNVYLTGKVYDTFEGNGWQQYNEDTSKERYMDTVETLYAVQKYDKEYQQDYVARAELKICYKNVKTGYVFAPLKTWSVKREGQSLELEDCGGSLLFDKKQGYGTTYDVVFYQLNRNQAAFSEFLETETEPDEETLESILDSFGKRTGFEITGEDMRNREQAIYHTYTEDVGLSEEVRAYLAQITEGADTKVERLRAIEDVLSSFTYNRTPGELPDTVRDSSTFLDYFLLDSRQGYCSHFATAFVLLARAEGIPARYVQGYLVLVETDSASDKEVIVTSDMAHAWPEVYFENIGWIPYEPTPGYAELCYTAWDTKRGESNFSTGAASNDSAEKEQAERGDEEVLEEIQENDTEEATGKQEFLQKMQLFLEILKMTIVLIFAIGLLMLIFVRLVGRWHYQRMSAKQKYIVEVNRNFRILSKLGLARKEGETLEEWNGRMSECLALDEKICFMEGYEEFLYGKPCVNEQMLQMAKEEQNKLLQLWKRKRRWRYVLYLMLRF